MTTATDKRECGGCGADLTGTHGKRKWCSERCRKRTLYAKKCVDCGGICNTDGRVAAASVRCRSCAEGVHTERNERIFAAWERGEQGPEIAAREGMTDTAVTSLINHHRLYRGRDLTLHRERDRDRWDEIEPLWREGLPAREIAERIDGLNAADVLARVQNMRLAGIDLPDHSHNMGRKRDEERAAATVALWAAGLSLREIGDHFGITRGAAAAYVYALRAAGYDLPYRRASKRNGNHSANNGAPSAASSEVSS